MTIPQNLTALRVNETFITDYLPKNITSLYNCTKTLDGLQNCSRSPFVISIVPGEQSDPSNVNLTNYEIISFSSDEMVI